MKASKSSASNDWQVFRIVLNAVLTSGSVAALGFAFMPGVAPSLTANVLGLWALIDAKKNSGRLRTQIKELSDEISALQADRDTVLQEAEQRLEETKVEYICVQESTKAQYKELLSTLKADHRSQLAELEAELLGLKSDYDCRLQAKELKLAAIETARQQLIDEFKDERAALRNTHSQALTDNKAAYEEQMLVLKTDYKKRLEGFQTVITELGAEVQSCHDRLQQLSVVPAVKGETDASAEVIEVLDRVLAEKKVGPLTDAQLAEHRRAIAQEIILQHGLQRSAATPIRVAA